TPSSARISCWRMRCRKARKVRSGPSLAGLDSTTGGTGLSDDGIKSPLTWLLPRKTPWRPTETLWRRERLGQPEQNGRSAVYCFHEGGSHGLEPSGRELEADEGRCKAAMGKTDRRRSYSDRRKPRQA